MPSKDHILYVEDEPLSRDVMQMMIENFIEPETFIMFEDSENFVQRVQLIDPQPTLILLDIHVTPLNGFEMLHELRELEGLHDTKIIALTASVMNEEVEKLRHSGFDGAIAKPLSAQQFPKLIEQIIRGEDVWYIGD